MIIIGIDPGKTGGYAIFEGGAWETFYCPTIKLKSGKTLKDVPDPGLMANALRPYIGQGHLFIESVHAMPKQGSTSMFNFGKGFGCWLGVIAALQIPHTLVTPQRWKKYMMDGMTKDKDASRQRAIQMFPYLSDELKLKKSDGKAEAVLIGEYGRRLLEATP